MATYGDEGGDKWGKVAAHIERLENRIRALEQRGIIPILDADPTSDDPTNLWMLNDGRLCGRDAEGRVRRYWPFDQQYVPTLATDPGASSGVVLWFKPNGRLKGRLADGTVVVFNPAPDVPTSSSDPGGDRNIWVNLDGTLRVRKRNGTIIGYAPASGGGGTSSSDSDPNSNDTPDRGTTSNDPKPPDPKPHTHTKTYAATWGKTLCERHGQEGGANLTYGRYSSTHGVRKVMFGFDDAAIRSDLAGATIRRVQLHMRNTHSWSNAGIEVWFGGHNQSSPPAAFSAVRRKVWHDHWPKSGDGKDWRTMRTTWFARALRDNTIKGLTIDQPSTSLAYYGECDWSSLRLRITYSHTH